jgi:hypothetical protein
MVIEHFGSSGPRHSAVCLLAEVEHHYKLKADSVEVEHNTIAALIQALLLQRYPSIYQLL